MKPSMISIPTTWSMMARPLPDILKCRAFVLMPAPASYALLRGLLLQAHCQGGCSLRWGARNLSLHASSALCAESVAAELCAGRLMGRPGPFSRIHVARACRAEERPSTTTQAQELHSFQ